MRRTAGLAVCAALTAACGGGSGGAPSATQPAPPVTTTRSVQSTVPVTYGGSPGAAERQACRQDVQTVQEASDTYAAENGHPAASLAALLAAGMLRSLPQAGHGYLVEYDPATGRVSAQGICSGG